MKESIAEDSDFSTHKYVDFIKYIKAVEKPSKECNYIRRYNICAKYTFIQASILPYSYKLSFHSRLHSLLDIKHVSILARQGTYAIGIRILLIEAFGFM